jgi:hypothetical protein
VDTVINFYIINDEDSKEVMEPYESIKSDNPMYFNLKPNDTIVLKSDNVEYSVVKCVKNLHEGQLNIYLDRIKSKEEIMDDIEELANKTLKSVLESLKDTFQSSR